MVLQYLEDWVKYVRSEGRRLVRKLLDDYVNGLTWAGNCAFRPALLRQAAFLINFVDSLIGTHG